MPKRGVELQIYAIILGTKEQLTHLSQPDNLVSLDPDNQQNKKIPQTQKKAINKHGTKYN